MRSRFTRSSLALLATLFGCASSGGPASAERPPRPAPGGEIERKVVVERMPDGSVKKTTITTTRKVVEPPPAPARPADPWPADPRVRYNVERVNAYRAEKGLPALLFDAKISAFAHAGSDQLSHDHSPHAHFAANIKGAAGFGSRSAENQGDPSGVPPLDANASTSGRKQIDVMLKLMMDEGPGGGHYENMMSTRYRRIGVGLVYAGGKLYMTNDFSD